MFPDPGRRPHSLSIGLFALLTVAMPRICAAEAGQDDRHWSFEPARRPEVPAVSDPAWVRNPIDAFILARLDQEDLAPSQPASRTALIKRVYFDLTGLPPTPDDVRAFLADTRPDAYERLVDRLLGSPQYGERWARHWLDVVRYAETDSFERDGAKPFVWRYRDYVIRSLNDDKPYDAFIREQLAGDELDAVTAETIIATGYYRIGQWNDEPSDKKQALYDDLDDILTTTAQAFLGLTINCARCHDHKFDPIPQTDYYRFLSFFRGIRRYGVRMPESVADASLRVIASPAERERHAVAVAAHKSSVDAVQAKIAAIEAQVQDRFSGVDKDEFKSDQNRERILRKFVPMVLSETDYQHYVDHRKRRDTLNRNQPPGLTQALCVKEHGAKAPATFVLTRGSPHAEGKAVTPGFPSALRPPEPVIAEPNPDAISSGRRRVVADWIANPDNPLTARVIVNRIWQHHWSRGIVQTPNDFGRNGDRPTHPELLDWLATELVRVGWRLKPIHRLIMTSSAYRMASVGGSDAADRDPANTWFWRFNPRRLCAEEIRDALHATSGQLNLRMHGPSIYAEIDKAVLHGQSQPGAGWGKSPPDERARRSLYIHVKRSLITPLLAGFDFADTDMSCPVRFTSIQPTQALTMLNGRFAREAAAAFASRLRTEAGSDRREQVTRALWLALCRSPAATDVDRGMRLMETLERDHGVDADDALVQFCLMVLNLNEFMFVD